LYAHPNAPLPMMSSSWYSPCTASQRQCQLGLEPMLIEVATALAYPDNQLALDLFLNGPVYAFPAQASVCAPDRHAPLDWHSESMPQARSLLHAASCFFSCRAGPGVDSRQLYDQY
jgi:hypothetical protein